MIIALMSDRAASRLRPLGLALVASGFAGVLVAAAAFTERRGSASGAAVDPLVLLFAGLVTLAWLHRPSARDQHGLESVFE